MALYIVLLVPIAVIAYGIGSMDSLVLASNFVFHANLRKLGTGSVWISNFRRIYKWQGILKLAGVEIAKDLIPVLFGGLILLIKGHFTEGCAFAGFCMVMGRLWPLFYRLKGSNAAFAMIIAALCVNKSLGIAAAVITAGLLFFTKLPSVSTFAGALTEAAVSLLVLD